MMQQSISHLSISESSRKKQKNNDNDHIVDEVGEEATEENQCYSSKKKSNDNLPDYLKVSNRIFKKMLIGALEGADKLVKLLNTHEKIEFARQYAYLIHKRLYVQLQQEQWNYYYHIGTTENIWSGRVSKKWAAVNSMYHTYGRSKVLVEQRCKTIERQFQEASQNLQQFIDQPLPQCMSELDPPFNFTTMSAIVTAFVRRNQHKLKLQFEHNKKMSKMDSTDHRLVQAVYDLKPNKQQIRSIQNRWKAIYNKKQMEEQIEILKHRIHSNRLPPAFNLLDFSLDKIDKILTRSHSTTVPTNKRTILSARRLKKIGRFKYDMLELSIAAGEDKVRYWAKIAEEEKKKMLVQSGVDENNQLSHELKQLMAAIGAREEHMIQRTDYITEQKLKSFFDEAPMVQDDAIHNSGIGADHH